MARKTNEPPRKYVRYKAVHSFQERTIRSQDWKLLGAEGEPTDTVWNAANKFRVLREDIPLDDELLEEYLKQDRQLVVVEE